MFVPDVVIQLIANNELPSQYLNVDNIHKNPIVLKYIREKKINTILD